MDISLHRVHKGDKFVKSFTVFLFFLLIILSSCTKTPSHDQLKESFIYPPDSAKPGVYWYFMDGNINREAITADLESMKKAGIGYALFLEVNVGIPRGKVDFLSEEWQELFTYAVREAERLGIRIILGSGPGWAGSGGPWVKPEESMMHLVASDTLVSGPCKFTGYLSVPKPAAPYFGESSLTDSLKKIRDAWFSDVRVLAFPYPGSRSSVERIDEKALYYRAPYTSVKNVLPYIPADTVADNLSGSPIRRSDVTDISDKMDRSGKLTWDVPQGSWIIMRFVARNNGAVTRPAPIPGLGFESDKFDTTSFDHHYNSYTGKLIKKVRPKRVPSGGGWTMIHIDSWEMGAQNWSTLFREQFMRRRGYDPVPFLPVYNGWIVGSREISERFLWDIRQTSNELIRENHAQRFRDLGRRNGMRLSIEPYDMNPAADFDLGSVADIPMCEFWSDGFGYNSSFSCIEATSIGHVTGSPVIASESFTAESDEAWKKFPGNMKNQGDWAFCMGINRFIYHTFVHKSTGSKLLPGMTMGPYGVHWDRGQTWWPMVSGYHNYITRCQFLLTQGKPVADILYITPEGAPQVFVPPSSALDGSKFLPDKKGYSFDVCSPAYLIRNASVKDNTITFPGGASYRVMVLPDIKAFTPAFMEKLESLVKSGAVVIGNPGSKSPSLSGYPECDARVKEISAKLRGRTDDTSSVKSRKYGKGTLISGAGIYKRPFDDPDFSDTLSLYPTYMFVAEILKGLGVEPDFQAGKNLRYTHRSLADREMYFVSNRCDSIVSDTCFFRNGTGNAAIWDAVSGDITNARTIESRDGRKGVHVRLEPYQSCFIFFYKPAGKAFLKGLATELSAISEPVMSLDGLWEVSFDPAWGGPARVTFDSLSDWTKRPEESIRHYSGIAVYTKTFDFPGFDASGASEFFLNLGLVKNMARVSLNGTDLGIIWTSPWRVKITGLLKEKNNLLKIEVANLWINRLIGDESKPWDGIINGQWPDWYLKGLPRSSGRYTFTTHHFYRSGDPLSESGLIGPVTIGRAILK